MNSRATGSAASAPNTSPRSSGIIGLFPDLLGVGGVQEAGRMTAAALAEIALRQGGVTDFLSLNDAAGPHTFETDGRAISLRGFSRAKIRFVLSGIRRARKLASDTARIVVAAHPHLALPASFMQRRSRGLRMIVMAHGIEVWSALTPMRRRALLRANVVLAPSRYTAHKLAEVQGVPPEKIRILPWPLNPDFLRMAAAPAAPPPPRFPNGQIVLAVGRWAASERYKGADELIAAVAQLRPGNPELRLVAVGGGDDLPRLRQVAASLNVADRVCFLADLSREQISACYSRADIFALPSTGEGFGLVFLEAMAFAKPVVGAAAGGATDVIHEGVNGLLVPPHDVEQLAGALGSLLRDEPLRTRLGRAGSEIARNKYSFSAFAAELERILASVDSI
jgi:phosphatidyl-myo-inositol dimannoside synthase